MIGDLFSFSDDDSLPALNCFFVSVNRHDRDRIELQCGFDGLVQSQDREFNYDVDFVLFVPKTLGLLEVDESANLRQEFQSYVRLHTHVSDPKSETSFWRVKERLHNLKEKLTIDNIRVFAIEFEGFMKAQSKKLRQVIVSANFNASAGENVLTEVQLAEQLIKDFRDVLDARGIEPGIALKEDRHSINHTLSLLNEYVSHLYVQYFSILSLASQQQPLATSLLKVLEDLSLHESQIRQKNGWLVSERDTAPTPEEDSYLRRIGVLKKYFQKSLFVQVLGESLQKRLLIPVYGISAALAASWAIMIQVYQARSMVEKVGINSIALITVGILAYVAKDIMKDFFRRFFLQKGSRWFPDFEKKLFIEREGKRMRLGEISEYIRSFDSEELPSDLKAVRYSVKGGEMEEFLHEDVLHFKKRVSLNLSELDSQKEFPWGLREIVRYRFDRLRTSMEDPFKKFHFVSKDGQSGSKAGHRSYHIHLAIWVRKTSRFKRSASRPEFKAYRISLDKAGVIGCEALAWEKQFGVPEIPV